ncbi:hypothetical protein O181_023501 [Austropuccinia psidii MF-1]|uniref:Uncharacterized protein n=1 Tax=Austropuccinia psidii MF-1 TaxID=1389203 RepID=A0A9Q3CJI2_9BASI|nr:hypothetical protein [Austropuccinia psidii MF-1]
MRIALEKEGPIVSTSSKPDPELPKDNLKGPRKNQCKGKRKSNWSRPYPQGYRIPKLKPSAIDSVLNMARTLMELTDKEQDRMNKTFPSK